VFKGVGELQAGKITEADLRKLEQSACPTCGSCSGMFTANSMNCLCEALGMALPGNGTVLAVSKEREALYLRAARAILKLVEHDLKPRDIATLEAFDNALALDVAMGGSTNTVLHTLAIAREAGIPYDIARIDTISRRVPCLCKVSPSSNYHVQDVHRAGGIHTILGELKRMGALTLTCKTVTGKTIGQNIDEWDVRSGKSCTPWAKAVAFPAHRRWCSIPMTNWVLPPARPAGISSPNRCCFSPVMNGPSRSGAKPPRSIPPRWRNRRCCLPPRPGSTSRAREPLIGREAIAAYLDKTLQESKGLLREELGQLRKDPVLIVWRYEKSGGRTACRRLPDQTDEELGDPRAVHPDQPGQAGQSRVGRPDAV
jgi:hypothetical protein